jgi:Domain of unknown function (DUF4476)
MKTIFTLFASLILGVAVMAAPKNNDTRPKSILTVRSSDRGDLRVIVDGRRFEPNDNYLRIQGIAVGYHNVKVYRERNSGIFSIFGKRYEVVFNSSVSLKPFTNVTILVDQFGRTTVNESRMNGRFGRYDRGFGNRDDRSFGDRDDKTWDTNHDFNFDGGGSFGDYDNGHDGKLGNNDRDNHDGGFGDRDNHGYKDYAYNNTMSDPEFNRVLASIGKEWFDANKAESAKVVICNSYFTAFQVKELLQLFSFENTKLELAKLAYSKTVDQKNYFCINEVFSFNSSKDELARYIRSCQ